VRLWIIEPLDFYLFPELFANQIATDQRGEAKKAPSDSPAKHSAAKV